MDTFAFVIALAAMGQGAEALELAQQLSSIGRFLSIWDATTGLPETDPQTMPYTYVTGDYYLVGNVAGAGGTNYKPSGTVYSGTPSTDVETESIIGLDMYRFDGAIWKVLNIGNLLKQFVREVVADGSNINDDGVVNLDAILHAHSATLETPLVSGKEYYVGNLSSLALTLPNTGLAQAHMRVVFKASAVFTPTISGTYAGDSIPTIVSGKTYDFLFSWNGAKWVFSWLEY